LRIEGPYIPAGTRFRVLLEQELGTAITPEGTVFEARVEDDLLTPTGHILVPQGALLRGKVVHVDRSVQPFMAFDFRTIGTTGGEVPVAATVTGAQEYAWLDPNFVPDSIAGSEAILHHPVYHSGFVPRAMSPLDVRPANCFSLPRGAELTLVLTHPLLGRSAVVSSAG
jgi:hypothetical protein